MPLTVFDNDAHPTEVQRVIGSAREFTRVKHGGVAVMGGFCTARNDGINDTALSTGSASSCLIIVVHCADGSGALGHRTAEPQADLMIASTVQMVETLACPASNVDSILYAGGEISYDQAEYEQAIQDAARAQYGNALVTWPQRGDGDGWAACAYLPRSGEVALFDYLEIQPNAASKADRNLIREFNYR